MRARDALIATLLVACGSKEPSEADKERATAALLCKNGDGQQCLIAAVGLDTLKKDQLQRAMGYWTRGCELKSGACCGQLGVVAAYAMTTGGANPDLATAGLYYALGCKYGDKRSCKDAGIQLPPGEDPDIPKFSWNAALTPVCSKNHGEMGPLFDGLVPGQPMPAAMVNAVKSFETRYKARVHYDPGDPLFLSSWSMNVRFEEKDGIEKALASGWGAPDLSFGAWISPSQHTIAYWMHETDSSGVSWSAYRTVDEVILPGDKTRLGIEPIAMIGAKLADVQAAIGNRMLRSGEDEYRYEEIAAGPAVEVHIVEKRGVIVELRTVNWFTNSSEVGDALFSALETKWGKPSIDKHGVHVWKLPGRTVRASKPASGNFEITMTKR